MNLIYNKLEDELKKPYSYLKEIVESKGNVVKMDEVIKTDITKEKEDKEIILNDLFIDIINVPLVYDKQYDFLCSLKTSNKATREEKMGLTKYYYYYLLGLNCLTYDLLNTFFYGEHLIFNFIALIDIANYK